MLTLGAGLASLLINIAGDDKDAQHEIQDASDSYEALLSNTGFARIITTVWISMLGLLVRARALPD